jgi:hypothetical protein
MPLLDHFHPPLSQRRHWQSFHSAWATALALDLNQLLPPGYFAEPYAHYRVEIDVATYDEDGGTAVDAPSAWTPPAPTQTLPLPVLTDLVGVHVFSESGGPTLAAAVELVSPSNKDRPATRDAFVNKCASYLHERVGLVIVDIVTEYSNNLHAALLRRVTEYGQPKAAGRTYAVAYRPVEREAEAVFEMWEYDVQVGQPLPTVPLWLKGGGRFPLDLDGTYERVVSGMRLGPAAQRQNGPPPRL